MLILLLYQVLVVCLMLAIVSITFPYWLTNVRYGEHRESPNTFIPRADWRRRGGMVPSPPSALVCLRDGRQELEAGPARGQSNVRTSLSFS